MLGWVEPSHEAPMQITNGAHLVAPVVSRLVPVSPCKCVERELGPMARSLMLMLLSGGALGFHSCFTSSMPGGVTLSAFPAAFEE